MICAGCGKTVDESGTVCPHCGASGGGLHQWDIVVTGFADDAAKVRTAEFLLSISKDKDMEEISRIISALPQPLFRNLHEKKAMMLTSRLKDLGARVTVQDAAKGARKNDEKKAPQANIDPQNIRIPIVDTEEKRSSFSVVRTVLLSLVLVSVPLVSYFFFYAGKKVETHSVQIAPGPAIEGVNPELLVDVTKNMPMKVQVRPEGVTALETGDAEVEKLNREGVDLSKKGRFDEAIDRYLAALKLAPDSEAIRDNLENTYLAAGSKVLEDGAFEEARDYFDHALQLKGSAAGFKGRGVAYGRLGDQSSALSDFSSSLELDDSDESLLLALAADRYHNNELNEAKEYFRKILALNPSNAVALGYLSKIKREIVEEEFREKESFHFYVKYEGAESGVAGHLVSSILEEAYQKVGADLGFYPDDMVTAILYTDKLFQDVTRSPSWAGGLYDGKIRIPVGGLNRRTDDLVRVIYHEYTHAVVHRITGGNCPTWLNEGLAQFEEGEASLSRAELIVKSGGRLVPLKYLEGSFMGLDRSLVSTAYAMSLLGFNYLENEYGLSTIRRILDELGAGKRGEAALSSAIYISYEDIERGVARRLRYSAPGAE